MIYITGDTHIPIDIHKLNNTRFPEQMNLNKNDYVIICGDFGGVWNNSKEEIYWLKWLNTKNFTTLFVDGNHENFNLLNQYEVTDFCGGKVHIIMSNIYHLMRGQVYTIDDKKIFTMGGASSHDKIHRKENISWWQEEIPSDEEFKTAIDNLDKHNWTVDYVITHCASDSIKYSLGYWYERDKITNFLEFIKSDCKYQHWYFGHYHIDKDIDEKHTVLYDRIIRVN